VRFRWYGFERRIAAKKIARDTLFVAGFSRDLDGLFRQDASWRIRLARPVKSGEKSPRG
jgi:hypothetical protein